jgi:manganese transport protein
VTAPPPGVDTSAATVALPSPSTLELIRARRGLRGVLPLLGPAFVAAIACSGSCWRRT